MRARAESSPKTKRRDSALVALSLVMSIAVAFAMLYALRGATAAEVVGRMSVAALLAAAATMTGGLLGFLFGIPRTLQGQVETENGTASVSQPRYQANTSLEQISDWLTKILVGVGLTQITVVPDRFSALGQSLGPAFGGQQIDQAFVITLTAMLLITGFLFGFLWTRLYLPGAFRAADLEEIVGEVSRAVRAQADLDAEALSLTDQVLNSTPGQSRARQEVLDQAIAEASPNARVLIFERARENRQLNWREAARKPHMERSIPLFRALIASGDSPIRHRYYGQLGFALKDQAVPDWAAAEKELTEAINLRGPWDQFGYAFYELNRAVCRMMQDPGRANGEPTASAQAQGILEDLRVAYQSGLSDVVLKEEEATRWLQRNGVTARHLADWKKYDWSSLTPVRTK